MGFDFISIDPGVACGWAAWRRGRKLPVRCGTIVPHRGDWQDRVDEVCRLLGGLRDYCPQKAYIEYPAFFETSGGKTSARSGALVKLAYACGRIHETCRYLVEKNVVSVPVNQWKGQLPKAAINSRILRYYAKQYGSKSRARRELESVGASHNQSHDWDSIGLGLWVKGVFR